MIVITKNFVLKINKTYETKKYQAITVVLLYIKIQKNKIVIMLAVLRRIVQLMVRPISAASCATQLQRNVATVGSRWRHCANFTGPGIKPQTSGTDSVCLATELSSRLVFFLYF